MSATRKYVDAFAERMEAKLDANRYKGNRSGWRACSIPWLLGRALEEMAEVADSLAARTDNDRKELFALRRMILAAARTCENIGPVEGTPRTPDECADGGNFLLFIADKSGLVARPDAEAGAP